MALEELNVVIFNSHPGEAIIFNDQLLHGGAVGQNETRVSLEFTMFVKKKIIIFKKMFRKI
jgi:ectoine hydroxylase-related dioxygenase (phytanoyl-CoA dioxygenase family)